MSDLKTHNEILKDEGVDTNKLAEIDPNLYSSIVRAMGEFADQYHTWKKANESEKSTEPALNMQSVNVSALLEERKQYKLTEIYGCDYEDLSDHERFQVDEELKSIERFIDWMHSR